MNSTCISRYCQLILSTLPSNRISYYFIFHFISFLVLFARKTHVSEHQYNWIFTVFHDINFSPLLDYYFQIYFKQLSKKKSKRNVILICHDGTVSRMQSIERSTSNATKFSRNRDGRLQLIFFRCVCTILFFSMVFKFENHSMQAHNLFCLFCETRYG